MSFVDIRQVFAKGKTYKEVLDVHCQAGVYDTISFVDIRLFLATKKGHAKRCLLSRQEHSPFMELEETWERLVCFPNLLSLSKSHEDSILTC